MTKSKSKIIIFIVLLFISVIAILSAFGINHWLKRETYNTVQNSSFFENYFLENSNENFAAVSDRRYYSYNIGTKIRNGEIKGNKEIAYMSKQYIYLSETVSDDVVFYKANYSLNDIEEIYRYKDRDNIKTYYFIDENILYYSDNGKYYTYNFSTGECSESEKNLNSHDKYNYETVSGLFDTKIILRDIYGNKIITLKYSEIINNLIQDCDVAKFLKNNDKLEFFDIEIQGEDIYMICSASGFQIIYQYDIDSNKFTFFSAVNSETVTLGGRETYYFN